MRAEHIARFLSQNRLMQLESSFQLFVFKSTKYSTYQLQYILNAMRPLFSQSKSASLDQRRIFSLWLICEMWQRHLIMGIFQEHHMASFFLFFLICSLFSYSAPFSLFQVLLSSVWGRPTKQVGLSCDSWAFFLEQTHCG